MVLQFQPPPDWLIKDYLDRRNQNPLVEAIGGANQIMQEYAKQQALQQQQGQKQAELDILKNKEAREGREQFFNFGDVASLPTDVRSQIGKTPQGPVTESGAPPAIPSLIQRYNDFLKQNPEGIKGREKKQNNRPQQVPQLIDGKPAVFNPETGQYEIAKVVDPTAPQTPVVPNPVFTPRVEPPPPSKQFVGVQGGQGVLLDPKSGTLSTTSLPGSGPITSTNQSEGQANATLYATRMEEADKQLNDLAAQTDLTSISSGIQGKVPNILKSGNIQKFEQSKRNFLNAVLRRESGAVISPTEFAEGNRQYFPVVGDSPEVLRQKALNRRTAIAGLNNAAGGMPRMGASSVPTPAGNAATGAKKIGRFTVEVHP